MRLHEITNVSDIHTRVRDFFDKELTAKKVQNLDYSQFVGYFNKVLGRLNSVINDEMEIAPFPILFQTSMARGGNVEFYSMDGESISNATVIVGVRGISGDELTNHSDRYITMFTNIVTHELGHIRQIVGSGNRPPAKILKSTRSSSNFLEYLNSALEREMQAVSAVIEIQQLARENEKSVNEFLVMMSKNLPAFTHLLNKRDDLIGLSNIFVSLRKMPDSKIKTQAYHRFLKTIYKYTSLIN